MTRLLPLALVLSTACAATQPATSTAPVAQSACRAAPATLRFAWPDGLQARVEGRDITESAFEDGSSPMRGDSPSDLRMLVSAEDQRLRVRFEVARRSRARSSGLAPEIAGVRPELVLSSAGEVVGVDGSGRMQQALAEAVQRGEYAPQQAQQMLHNIRAEALLANARGQWDWVLRAWHGRSLRCGEVVRERVSVPGLSLGALAPIATDVELELLGDAPCGPITSREGARCVRLQARQYADRTELVGALAQQAAQLDVDARVPAAELTRTFDLIVEVDTLVPHRVRVEERSAITWRDSASAERTRHVHDVQDYSFDYSPEEPRGTTTILIDPNGGGSMVLRDGQPVQLPDTPACRAFLACCDAMPNALFCALMISSFEGPDCTAELEMARMQAGGRGGAVPAECR